MDTHPVGSVWLFTLVSWWLVFLMVVAVSTGSILLIRWCTEGRLYDIARSSTPGDQFLALYCGIVAYICQKELPAGVHTYLWWHITLAIFWILVGIGRWYIAVKQGGASRRWTLRPANTYHEFVVVPVLGYLIASTLPILWTGEKVALQVCASACLLVWLALVGWDIKHGNFVPRA